MDVDGRQITSLTVVHVRWEVVALAHAVLVRLTTDVVSIVPAYVIFAEIESVQFTKPTPDKHASGPDTYDDLLPYFLAILQQFRPVSRNVFWRGSTRMEATKAPGPGEGYPPSPSLEGVESGENFSMFSFEMVHFYAF